MKKMILDYVLKIVESAIDQYVQSTPTQLDDMVWSELKKAISEALHKGM